jgi:hypothetical protein
MADPPWNRAMPENGQSFWVYRDLKLRRTSEASAEPQSRRVFNGKKARDPRDWRDRPLQLAVSPRLPAHDNPDI